MSIFFTSDTHFGHKAVIEYCKRPFASVEEMDAEMIRRWNAMVRPEDYVYHLGDFAFCGAVRHAEILSKLNGEKTLIRGNHDHWKPAKYARLGFAAVWDTLNLGIFDGIHLSHFPYRGFEVDERTFENQLIDDGLVLLHGHVHCAWKKNGRMINVGVDQWNFSPVSYEEIKDLMVKEGVSGAGKSK